MSIEFDVRNNVEPVIERIRFANDRNSSSNNVASILMRDEVYSDNVLIYDAGAAFVLVDNAEHARHLIAALDKAIKIGWLK